ncbi:MAG TPA: HD domain-containing phosphohydrolase [Burkholderiales bacterium]|nr:HD domain-containing phosphohydrolase [Burkholderiales bacterium]
MNGVSIIEAAAGRRILLVDDEPNVLSALRRSLRGRGFDIATAGNGEQALAELRREPVDAIVCDMRMPGMSGAEVLKASIALAPDAVRVLLTGYADVESTVRAVNEGEIFRYLAKPWDDAFLLQVLDDGLARKALERERDALLALTEQQNRELRTFNARLEAQVAQRTQELQASMAELRKATERLKDDFAGTVRLLSGLVQGRAGLTARCPSAVARHVRAFAPRLDLAGEALHDLTFAALLQDLGKVALPDALVRQPFEALDTPARQLLLNHPQIGRISMASLASLRGAGEILGSVQENFDGSGVPGKASGEDIPLGARALRVASDFEQYLAGALTLEPLSPEQAFRRLRQSRGTRYDPRAVDAFLAYMEQPVTGPARKVLMSSANVRVGMRLAQDLVTGAGSLLLARGYVLDEGVIAQLRRLEEFSGEFLWIAVSSDDGVEVRVGEAVAP